MVLESLCTFSQKCPGLGGLVVVLWSSGGGCYVGRGRAQKLRHAQKHHRARYGTVGKSMVPVRLDRFPKHGR
jgi:hypothetical protein